MSKSVIRYSWKGSVKLASTQKDMLIAELKAENYELKQRDKDYGALYNWLVDTE